MELTLFGCKETTYHVSKLLSIEGAKINLVTISPEKGKDQSVAGYKDLTKYNNIYSSIYIAEKYNLKSNNDLINFQSKNQHVGFVMGWQRLIPKEILDCFSCGVFGMHGSAQDLPYGRGRSPMNWSLIEGRKWFYTNLFKYDAGVDSGRIVGKECFSVNRFDTAETLHYKNLLSFINIIKANWNSFENNIIETYPQKEGKGSFYPKRSPEDGIIDWNNDIFKVERFIRAVTLPFDGAFSFIGKQKIQIYRANIFYTDIEMHQFKQALFGEICDVFPNGKFLVRLNGGVLIVHDFDLNNNSISLIKKGNIFHSPEGEIKRFNINKYGYYDN